ncbi:DM13 domain-containing protein [Flammeovirga kamogawensis]|uniref:DM13 domain-containing protein n=1 Tax=Flammeovirga kamogawensis TaxID=373891 RepID=A0ABX8GZF5_9BACT|nr:DM13 domain-containing protein [Flammeovirga kamogawensis]MBB6459441.1 hypothetical protein [Flammeovirga kamogawensis]QWG08994.1 DM13 domain-containing protein [Flammeovirga kamogawensis]TRX67285.1 DM13 domain-containing protein [Flammeovirga kamogawensis]
MKLLAYSLLICLLFSNCNNNPEPEPLDLSTLTSDMDDDMDSNSDSTNTDEDEDEVMADLMGNFENGAHPTSGSATIKDLSVILNSDFMSDNGPDLYVYLAQDLNGNGFIDLGRLQAVSGTQTYSLPEGIDYSKNKYLLIWCKQYSVLFGHAVME